MITDATESSYRLNDELIDLTPLYTRVQLLGDGKTIHTALNHYAVLKQTLFLFLRDGIIYNNEARLLERLYELRTILYKAGV